MSKIYKGATELIGNTPLLEVTNIEKELGLEATVLVKLDYDLGVKAGSRTDIQCGKNIGHTQDLCVQFVFVLDPDAQFVNGSFIVRSGIKYH